MAVVEHATRSQFHLARGAVDRGGAVGNQLDLLVGIEFFRPEEEALRPGRALDIGFRQRRPLIWQMRFVIYNEHGIGETELAQRGGNLKACMPGPDDHDGSLRHWGSPTDLSMSFP